MNGPCHGDVARIFGTEDDGEPCSALNPFFVVFRGPRSCSVLETVFRLSDRLGRLDVHPIALHGTVGADSQVKRAEWCQCAGSVVPCGIIVTAPWTTPCLSMMGAQTTGEDGGMVFRVNYRQQRSERDRVKQAKKEAKLREREEAAARRKLEEQPGEAGEAGPKNAGDEAE